MMQGSNYTRRMDVGFLVLLLMLVAWMYGPSMTDIVVFDDAQIIRGQGLRPDLLANAPRFVTHATYAGLDYLFPSSVTAQKYFNLFLHGIVVIVLYALLRQWVGFVNANTAEPSKHIGRPLLMLGMVPFALSPVATYAIAYLVQRSILLATLFVILMLMAFFQGVVARQVRWWVLSLVLYALAVLSKELAVTAILLPALMYVFLQKPDLRRMVLLPAMLALPLAVVTYFFLAHYGLALFVPYEPSATQYLAQAHLNGAGQTGYVYALHLLNQLNLFFGYGLLWVLPNPQWMSIDLQPLFPTSATLWLYLPLAVAFVVMVALAVRALFMDSARARLTGLLLLIPVVLFLTELAMVRIQEPFVLYRSYLWAIGLPGLIALALHSLRIDSKKAVLAGVAMLVTYGAVTFNRASTFSSSLALWTDAVDKPMHHAYFRGFGAWRAYINRGGAYLSRGEVRAALEDFQRAHRMNALHGVARYNAGVVFQMLGQHVQALDAFKNATANNDTDPLLQYRMGESYYAISKFEDALRHYELALPLVRDEETAFLVLVRKAEVLIVLHRFDAAQNALESLNSAQKNQTRVRVALGMASLGRRDFEKAEALFTAVVAEGADANAYYGLAQLYEATHKPQQARQALERATAVDSKNALIQSNALNK